MFDLANDRLGYSELLRPDTGYILDFAVGMTYSLDLEALLGVPVSLGLLDDSDEGNLQNHLYVLEAIRKSADRIVLFCNAGGIKLPKRIQSVYSLLENSVFQIKLKKKGNFHPKVWVLKYSHKDCPPYIRLLVMSRNLTFDSSIDVSVALRGEIGKAENEKNRSLSDLLHFVANYAGRKKQQVLSLADDVLRVPAFEVSPPFDDYDFYPIGIPGYKDNDFPLFGQKYNLFAVSPFLSDEIIRKMTDFNGPRSIVTRKSSVTPTVLNSFDHVYVTKDVMSDNEYGAKQDIHAKIYYTTTAHGNYLYIGSANASRNAFSNNVECLIRLKYKLYGMGYKRFCSDFIPSVNCPYEPLADVPVIQGANPRMDEIDQALREAVYALKRASVTVAGKYFSVTVEAKQLKTKETIFINPLQCGFKRAPLKTLTTFSGLLLEQLSEFYVLSVEDEGEIVREIIVKITTRGIPKNRDQSIYRGIINDNSKFMRYLAIVLSGELPEQYREYEDFQVSSLESSTANLNSQTGTAVYEQMLRVFHQDPSKLRGIADMIQKLDPSVVGEQFIAMFREFEAAAKKVRK